MKPDRHTWIDYARGIAIVLVLYRHVFEGIKNSGIDVTEYALLEHVNILLFSFRMPLFFIVSGIFVDSSLRKRGPADFVSSKLRTILYPYFLWGGIQITLQIIFSGYVNSERTLADYLYLFYLPRRIDQFWYLLALFNVSMLYVLATVVFRLRRIQNFFLGVILYFISFWAVQNGVVLGFLGDLCHYFLFYIIGVAISEIVRNEKNYKFLESWKSLLLLLPLFIYSQSYFLTEI
jgi:fucose 4-O-acetylase-like acetyltransferase